jgi:hypothetical protein
MKTFADVWPSSLLVALSCLCLYAATLSGQEIKKKISKPVVSTDVAQVVPSKDEVISRLVSSANELKSESDKPTAAVLQSEIADVLWGFDEPTARSIFRLAFDTARKPPDDDSSLDEKAKSASQARRRASAIRTVLKRYGSRDRKNAEAWLKEFENEVTGDSATPASGSRISQQQADLLAEVAIGLVPRDPKKALELGSRSLSADEIPSAFGRLLMALRDQNKVLADVLYRQAIQVLRTRGFKYNSVLISLTNYEFFLDGKPFPDTSPAEFGLLTQYFVDASSAQAARARNGGAASSDEQASMGSLYGFLLNRAIPIIALNSPDLLAFVQSNVNALAQALTLEQKQNAQMLASLRANRSEFRSGNDDDVDARVHRAEQEKSSATRNLLLRNLVVQLMRSNPDQALAVTTRIDDADLRAQAEDDVYLVLLQNAFQMASYEDARKLALKMNETTQRAKWLAEIAAQVSTRSKQHTDAIDLLNEAYSVVTKNDNTPAKLQTLLQIAREFVTFDKERSFEILGEAVQTANKLKTPEPKTKSSFRPAIRIVSMTVVNGKEVSTDDVATVDSIDFSEVGPFTKQDYVRTSLLGNDLKDRPLRTKYIIAVARSVLDVPRQGSGYERSLEDFLSPSN